MVFSIKTVFDCDRRKLCFACQIQRHRYEGGDWLIVQQLVYMKMCNYKQGEFPTHSLFCLGSAITGPIGKECADLWPRIASAANAIV